MKGRAAAWQPRKLQIHGGANCTIYQFYQEEKQGNTSRKCDWFRFRNAKHFSSASIIVSYKLFMLLVVKDRQVFLAFFFLIFAYFCRFSVSHHFFFYFSSRAKQMCAVNNTSCRFLRSDAGEGEEKGVHDAAVCAPCRDSRAEESHNPAKFWHEVTFKGRDLFPTTEEVLRIISHLFLWPTFQRAEALDNYSV